jgi:hypothetical protein
MKDKFYNKSLVCGTLILFIGASIIPSISGFTGKMSIQSIIEFPTNFPINNNYMNGYWKFDECNGTIAYDSSGHNYDGNINGASWTTGHSGCSLLYDGIDDNVSLDDFSENLGFNKTDDFRISLYFKSTSTDDGYIYCMSDSDGANLEFSIRLNSVGNLRIGLYVLACGITLISNDTYNDDLWHNVEFFYHSSTSNPTLELYVDGNFDNSITAWICSFEDDDFKKAKMGSSSYDSIKHFNGRIDEFKIFKYPQGNKQEPPTISGPTSGGPGVEYDFTFITNDPEGDDIWLYIDWNDSEVEDWIGPYESGEEVIVSHEWDEEEKYEIKARSKDIWHYSSWSEPHTIRIGNLPPDTPTIDGPQFGDVGVEYEYTFNAVDPNGDDVQYFIDWGDTKTEWTDFNVSGTDVTVSHNWSEKGTYTIKVKAKDVFDAESYWARLTVTMPRNKILTSSLLLRFLEKIPLLERLMLF